jgi:hypothetical protein
MIEAVTAVARADAVAIAAVAGANARRTFEGRQKRMRWLDALRIANGQPHDIDDEERDEALLADNRQRIRAALDTIEELRGLDKDADVGDEEETEEAPSEDAAMSASAIARLMLAHHDLSMQAQAHLGAVSVRQLLG